MEGFLMGAAVLFSLLVVLVLVPMHERIFNRLEKVSVKNWLSPLVGELGGYVHDTGVTFFLPATQLYYSAGTWAMAVASNVWTNNRTAADANFTIGIPLTVPSNSAAQKGFYLRSLEIMYQITAGAMDDVTTVPTLYKDTFSVNGTINTAASVTTTLDSANDTGAELKTQDEHRVTMTLSTPVWIDNDEHYHVEMVVDGSAAGVFKYHGTLVNGTLRL